MVARSVWLDLTRREYLRRFIPGGGAAIKFVMGDDAVLEAARCGLVEAGGERNQHVVAIDGATTKIHMIQDVFFAISRSIDWQGLAQAWVEGLFAQYRYRWPRPGESVPLAEIAASNDVDELLLRREMQQWLARHVMRDKNLAQDFRAAMTGLCMRRLELGDERATAPVIEWLKGELRTIGPVRQVPISAKITRHNGRSMLRSLCHWLRMCNIEGVVVTLDLRQLGRSGPKQQGVITYTPAAAMDAYEVLRQIIDDAESFNSLFLAVLVDPSFRDDESKRGVTAYRALKERIWPDIHPRAHQNPLTPLVQIAEESDGDRPVFRELLEMPFNEERVAIEALRAGVPNRAAIRQLGSAEDALCQRFLGNLRRVPGALTAGESIEGELVAGGFGSGKSHLLGYLAEQAMKENFVVSILPVSKETPLFDPQRMYAAAVRNAVIPANDEVMTAALARLNPTSDRFAELERWASDPRSGLSAIFAALLYLIPKQVTTNDDLATMARFLGGSQLNVKKVKEWLRAAGALKLFNVGATKSAELALQRLHFAPRLFQAAGYAGWCILIDEVELIGRYSTLQRAKSYAELCRWLNLDTAVGVPGIVTVAAITDDFNEQVLHLRLDQEKAPDVLRARGLDEQARLAEIGMRRIERNDPHLRPPTDDQLHRSLDRVRHLYAESYGWPAEPADVGGRDRSKTMRAFIKSWVTLWDIRRIFEKVDEIDTETLTSDYSEDTDLEIAPPEEAVEDA